METENRLVIGRVYGKGEMRSSFLMVMGIPFGAVEPNRAGGCMTCECTKYQWTVHFKMDSSIVYELYLKKVQKKEFL